MALSVGWLFGARNRANFDTPLVWHITTIIFIYDISGYSAGLKLSGRRREEWTLIAGNHMGRILDSTLVGFHGRDLMSSIDPRI
jgi:hypothetical protein